MSFRRPVNCLVFLAIAAGPTAARAQQAGGINFVELFQTLDANDDKVISQGEVPDSARAAFERLAKLGDTNHDGAIDQEEYRALLGRARDSAMSAVPRTPEAFKAADKDGDGKLDRREFTGLPAMFFRIDADGDGSLSHEEVARFNPAAGLGNLPGLNQFGPRFLAMDKNNDRKVSRDEFQGPPANFDRIDADKDGFITPSEVRRSFLNNPPAAKKADAPDTNEAKTK